MLRDYQIEICTRVREAFRKHRSVMVQMPTGTGKTVVLASLVKEYRPTEGQGSGILIVAHRRELIEQIKATIRRMGIDGKNMTVESIQTISRRMETPSLGKDGVGLVVIDEAHHALAKTYRMLWEAWPQARFLGLTATPCRLNGKGFTDLFDVLLSSLSVPQFIQKGVLAPFDYVAINEGSSQQQLIHSLKKRGADGDYQVKEMNEVLNQRVSIAQLYDCYTQFAKGKKGIIYAISIEHARSIAACYVSQGVRAVAISAKTPAKERAALLEQFRNCTPSRRSGGLQVLVNVDIFSEGFDCPDVEFIQLARPTLSLAKYLQMVGRGLRPHKNKACCIILDNVGLVHLFGLPTRCWNWQSAFNGTLLPSQPGTKATSSLQSPSQAFSLILSHTRLEELISSSNLESWNTRQGLLEEPVEPFQSNTSRFWGLRQGGQILVPPTYLRVFNIQESCAAVRLQDTKLAVVDLSGTIVRHLGKGSSALLYSEKFVRVERARCAEYIDLLSGQSYSTRPKVLSSEELQMIYTEPDSLTLRLKDPFFYGTISSMVYRCRPKEYGYFYLIGLINCQCEMKNYAVDTSTLVVFKGDNERAYFLYDVHGDNSIDVIDRFGNSYHVTPDGKKAPLNRLLLLNQSLKVLNEISTEYKQFGGDPTDALVAMNYRNWVLHHRLSDKLKAFQKHLTDAP